MTLLDTPNVSILKNPGSYIISNKYNTLNDFDKYNTLNDFDKYNTLNDFDKYNTLNDFDKYNTLNNTESSITTAKKLKSQ